MELTKSIPIQLQFDNRKMGDDKISKAFRGKLEKNFDNFQCAICQTLDAFNQCSNQCNDIMHESLNKVDYFSSGDFMAHHLKAKNEALTQVIELFFKLME